MKTTRETSSSPGFTKNSMYVMPRRGSSTRVAFTAFLRVRGGKEAQSHSLPLEGAGACHLVNRTGSGGGSLECLRQVELGFQEGLSGLEANSGSELGSLKPPMGRGGRSGYLY